MRGNVREYFEILKGMFDEVIATGLHGEVCQLDEAVENAVSMIVEQTEAGGKVIFIGNGASASIASHMFTDFWKNADMQALAFNDSSLLTCVSNDYGYEYVFEKPIEMFARAGDVLFAISSSGSSKNIIRAVRMAQAKKCHIVTLSGFSEDNPLRFLGDLNFYVPYSSYGPVEIVHHSICHCILDSIIRSKAESKTAEIKAFQSSRL